RTCRAQRRPRARRRTGGTGLCQSSNRRGGRSIMSATQEQTEPLLDHYLAEYARVESELPGSEESTQARAGEMNRFAAAGFPTPRNEDWKYTSLKLIKQQNFELGHEPAPVALDELRKFLPEDLDTYRLVLVDGHYNGALSDLGGLPGGIRICSFAQYLSDHAGATVKAHGI